MAARLGDVITGRQPMRTRRLANRFYEGRLPIDAAVVAAIALKNDHDDGDDDDDDDNDEDENDGVVR